MYVRDYRDIIGGFLLVAIGLFIVAYAGSNYTLGTMRVMGPGMFPTLVGWLLAAVGALIVLPAFFRHGPRFESLEVRPMIASLLGVAAFALVDTFGLIIAVIAVTVISTSADQKLGLVGKLVLGTALALLCVAIFRFGLGLQTQPFPRFF